MKTRIESNGETCVCRLTAEDAFEQSAIDAINAYRIGAEISKDDSSSKTRDANDPVPKYDTLVISMKNEKAAKHG